MSVRPFNLQLNHMPCGTSVIIISIAFDRQTAFKILRGLIYVMASNGILAAVVLDAKQMVVLLYPDLAGLRGYQFIMAVPGCSKAPCPTCLMHFFKLVASRLSSL